MTARLAIAAGVLALVGAAAAGYLVPPSVANHAEQAPAPAAASTALPKPVQTVSIQRPADAQPSAHIVKDDARVPQANALVDAALPAPLQSSSNDPSIAPLTLTTDERADLLAFLKSLTDQAFLTDPRWTAP